jgi:hypothetical protein
MTLQTLASMRTCLERGNYPNRSRRTKYAVVLLFVTHALVTNAEPARAATVSAATCEQAAVNAAIAQASPGDVVQVPAGTCTWGAAASSVWVNKAITLRGAGRGVTTIEIASTAGSWGTGIIGIGAAATVRGFTIKTATGAGSGTAFVGVANGFRITDIEYIDRSARTSGYFLYAGSYGLVDNCSITGGRGDMELIFARGPADSWQTNHSIGGADNLFIENNEFLNAGYVSDCNSNSRCVVRYNTITGQMKVDGHGKSTNTPARSVRHMEVYNNRWTYPGPYWAAMELRGGGGRVFNNVADNTPWLLLNEYGVGGAYANFGGVCQCPANYPIDDQIGVGIDPKSAASEPMYLWNNTAGGSAWGRTIDYAFTNACTATCGGAFSITDLVKSGRDYFISASKPAAMSGYQPYTCPHPSVGTGSCGAAAGRGGYAVVATEPPSAPIGLRVVP